MINMMFRYMLDETPCALVAACSLSLPCTRIEQRFIEIVLLGFSNIATSTIRSSYDMVLTLALIKQDVNQYCSSLVCITDQADSHCPLCPTLLYLGH